MLMLDGVMEYARQVMDSPVIYLVIFAAVMADAIIPMAPSDAVLITAGVFSVEGKPNVALIATVGALGAMAGDHTSYFLGRKAGGRLAEKKGKGLDWARRAVDERGGLVLFVARYIPGGRVAATVTMGAMRYPLARFTFFDAMVAVIWSVQWTLVGYFGGAAFEKEPMKGLLLGFGIAIAAALVTELVRRFNPSRSSESSTSGARRHRVP